MKKTLLVTYIMFIGFSSFAKSKNLSSKEFENKFTKVENFNQINRLDNGDCTVTMTGTISIAGSGFSVACAATASNCDAATTQALNCVGSAINRIKKMFK